jgi:glutathione S-transferase
MRLLYHQGLSPFCRKVRIALREKALDFELRVENVWDRRREFLTLNPAGEVPVLVEPDGTAICGSDAICEYLEETVPAPALLPGGPAARAEVRRLVAWFDQKFAGEVSGYLIAEKVVKRMRNEGAPDSRAIRAAKENVHYHLDYIGWLSERRTWLAGDQFSLADIAAGAHVSAIDYLNDVPWGDHEAAKQWYARIKSRPSFRPILGDHLPGDPPPRHYADLDF